MRLLTLAPSASLLLLVVAPSVIRAQFQEPTKEELAMTADAKAPGAGYIYLYREHIDNESDSIRSFYDRIKILTEKGKEAATIRIPYFPSTEKFPVIEGRTIHADGTVVPLDVKPDDLVDIKTKDYQADTIVFTLPSAEVGSILEYRVREKFAVFLDDPMWMIQESTLVRRAHYFFKPSGVARMSYIARLPPDAKIQYDRSGYILDLTDVPPLPDEDWMPPLNTIEWRVIFFKSLYETSAAFWDYASKRWAAVTGQEVEPTGGLKKAVAQIVAPADTPADKLHKIYAAVMTIENTDYTREKSKAERKKEKIKDINTVEDVWKEQRGNSNDIALLFVALGRAAGLPVDPMKVVDRQRALYDGSLLNSGQFEDYIAVAQLDGKDIFLDPGSKFCPFGLLTWGHQVTSGFRLIGKSASVASTPSAGYTTSTVVRVADLTLSATGDLQGSMRIVLTGQEGLYWRQLLLQNDEGEVKKRIDERFASDLPEGVQGDFDHFLGLDNYESSLLAILKVSGTLGSATGKRFFLPGLFCQARGKHPFVAQESRKISVDVHYPRIETDDVTIHLPAGYSVESAPQPSNIVWPEYALLKINSKLSPDSINVTRALAYNFTIVDPTKYTNLHDFYQKVATADHQQIVLTRSPAAAKSN